MAITRLEGSEKDVEICRLSIGADMTIYGATENHQELMNYLAGADNFEIDLSEVEEIDCSGIQLLLALKKSAEKETKQLRLSKASSAINEAMDILNIKHRFDWADQGQD